MLRALVLVSAALRVCHSGRILVVYPTPAPSHRGVIIPLAVELARRHHVTIVTGAESFHRPHEVMYEYPSHRGVIIPLAVELARSHHVTIAGAESFHRPHENISEVCLDMESFPPHPEPYPCHNNIGNKELATCATIHTVRKFANDFQHAMTLPQMKEFFKDKDKNYFDLLVVESWVRPLLALAHVFAAPVVQINSAGATVWELEALAAPTHPLLYPTQYQQRVYNLSAWERAMKVVKYWRWQYEWWRLDAHFNAAVRRALGDDVPALHVLACHVRVLIVNEHAMWAGGRPDPPNVVRVWGIHLKPPQPLPQELQSYLDSSTNGVVYMSFGTSFNSYMLPDNLTEIIVRVLSRLPYDVLLKWDKDKLPGHPNNVRIGKFFPQADLLKHPNIKLFITQGGMQSTDEAIDAGVPLLGIPMIADQWFQTEKYVHFGIGMQIYAPDLTEEGFLDTIHKVINDESYRAAIARLRTTLQDEPSPRGAARAAWHVDHVMRHPNDHRLRPPCISWNKYLELDLLIILLLTIAVYLFLVSKSALFIIRRFCLHGPLYFISTLMLLNVALPIAIFFPLYVVCIMVFPILVYVCYINKNMIVCFLRKKFKKPLGKFKCKL